MFKYSGEIDVGNKIGDVKYNVPQEIMTEEIKEAISARIDSTPLRLELIEKINMALTFLQQAGAKRELPLLNYLSIFKINVEKFKFDQMDLRVMHIVHLFEVLEGLLFEDLIAETNPRYHLELNKEQKIEAKKFYSQE